MQFFPLVDFQHWVLAIFMGLISLVLIYLAFGSHTRTRRPSEEPEDGLEHNLLLGHGGEKNPVAPLLVFIYAGVVVFAIGYLIVVGLRGGAF